MILAVLLLHGLSHAAIGVLPRIFFRQGKLNLMWWLTAGPFIANGAILLLTYLQILPTFAFLPGPVASVTSIASVVFAAAAIGLLFYTFGTHRIPIALWHQDDDAPQHIVTWGAYARVRHPFYASFLLALIGAFLFAPAIGTAATLLWGVVQLNRTAAREEKRLAASEFGAEYRAYIARTGRFLPRLGAGPA
jgi:protein-S-isoprenylcysteine O-methyltransferase Ste14